MGWLAIFNVFFNFFQQCFVGFGIKSIFTSLGRLTAPHSSTPAWEIPWTEEPGGLQSMGSLRVGHNWATSLSLLCIGEGNGNPLQCSCLENPRDRGTWWAAVYGVTQSQTRLKRLSSSSSEDLEAPEFLNSSCLSLVRPLWHWETFVPRHLNPGSQALSHHSYMCSCRGICSHASPNPKLAH